MPASADVPSIIEIFPLFVKEEYGNYEVDF